MLKLMTQYCCAFILLLVTPISFAAITVKIALSDYPPYIEQSAEHYGPIPHLISAALKQQGYHVEYEFIPWHAHYDKAQQNEFDASAFWLCTPEREKMFYCSESIYTQKTVFFYDTKNPMPKWRGLHDLSDLTLAYMTQYNISSDLRLLANKGVLMTYADNDGSSLLSGLLSGQHDVVAMPQMVGNWFLNQSFQEDKNHIAVTDKAVFKQDLHVLFLKRKKQSRRLRVDLNKGLSAIKKSGEYQTIIASYLK